VSRFAQRLCSLEIILHKGVFQGLLDGHQLASQAGFETLLEGAGGNFSTGMRQGPALPAADDQDGGFGMDLVSYRFRLNLLV
jgi:hypothetical protein